MSYLNRSSVSRRVEAQRAFETENGGTGEKEQEAMKYPSKCISYSVQTTPNVLQSLKERVSSTKTAQRSPHLIWRTLFSILFMGKQQQAIGQNRVVDSASNSRLLI